jgi:Arc/MetJ family transcription regulator
MSPSIAGAWRSHLASGKVLSRGHAACFAFAPLMIRSCLGDRKMRMTLTLDDELVVKAQALAGLKEECNLIREALKALIERESARRLALLGGSEPGLAATARRRSNRA